MKSKLIFFSLIMCHKLIGQTNNKLYGKWQAETATLSSMNFDMYQFDKFGRFVFKPNGYNGLTRIISIDGSYNIKSDTIFFITENIKEIKGDNLIRSESTTLSDTWEIINGQTVVKSLSKQIRQSAIIKLDSDLNSLTLDGRKFFKVE